MDAKEFLKKKKHSEFCFSSKEYISKMMEEYAEYKVKNCNAPAVSKCEGLQRKLQLAITGLSIISKNGDGASSEYASELINDIDNCC